MGRRILITGVASFWGGRLAKAFEADPDVETIVGIDTDSPSVALERTEFVRSDDNYSILARLVRATQVDTVVHADLVVDSALMGDRRLHEKNVISTMNLLAAVSAADSKVTSLVVKSSALVYGASSRDPTWFREESVRARPPRTRVEKSLLEVEDYLRSFAEEYAGVRVAVLRYANVLGDELATFFSRALTIPLTPAIAGFDPLLQFVAEEDVIHAMVFAVTRDLVGVYNVAGDGRIPWSEVRAIAGRRPLLLSPVLTEIPAALLDRLGIVKMPPEIRDLLRYGRGIDNAKLKAAGFKYAYSTSGAIRDFIETQRLRRVVGETKPTYRYDSDVEAFFLHSPAVVRDSN